MGFSKETRAIAVSKLKLLKSQNLAFTIVNWKAWLLQLLPYIYIRSYLKDDDEVIDDDKDYDNDDNNDKFKMAITRPILKLQPQDFALWQM